MIKVSVILPSLNVAGYIRETMESVLAQTLKEIEIICVDAGSTDGTLEILEGYLSGDTRVRLIRADRKSYGYQMNIGIAEATGEYIGIVETDDYIEKDMYETLYLTACENDADIVKSDFDVFTTDKEGRRLFVGYSLKRYNHMDYDKVYSSADYLEERVKPECYIWNAIYKREYLLEKNIRFNETPGASFQDFGFRYQTVYTANRIVAVDRAFYHYRRDNSNASTYNARTEEYNLRETEFSITRLKELGVINNRTTKAIVNEFIEFAFWPYIEMLKWNTPSDGTKEALNGYRKLFSDYMDKGCIIPEGMNQGLWLDTNLLIEGTEVFMGYAAVVARLEAKKIIEFLSGIKSEEKVILFGTGIRGNAIYVFLKNNRVDSIKAFCDNDIEKQGSSMYGVDILSPEDTPYRYPDARYILTSSAREKEMRQQLESLGIDGERISLYTLPTDPLFCTNCLVEKTADKKKGIG